MLEERDLGIGPQWRVVEWNAGTLPQLSDVYQEPLARLTESLRAESGLGYVLSAVEGAAAT